MSPRLFPPFALTLERVAKAYPSVEWRAHEYAKLPTTYTGALADGRMVGLVSVNGSDYHPHIFTNDGWRRWSWEAFDEATS